MTSDGDMKLIGKRRPSQGKGGETPGAKEKGMDVYGFTMALCFANGQTGRWARTGRVPTAGCGSWARCEVQGPFTLNQVLIIFSLN